MSDKYIIEYGVANMERGPKPNNPEALIVTKTLHAAVNEMIAQGYQPYGDPFTNPATQMLAQAMVKYGDKPLQRPSAEVLTRRDQ
jgi:hypothetical protein